jgi:hypothetical protein
MAKQRASRSQSYFPAKIPIYSLSGGVGRQMPSKRMPSEVDEMINFFCTPQSSCDKRNGAEYVANVDTFTGSLDPDDLFFHWMQVDNDRSILTTINSNGSSTDFMKVWEISLTGAVTEKVIDFGLLPEGFYEYVTYVGDTSKARERLKAINIGVALLILNKDVTAGFTSLQEDGDEFLKNLDGTRSTNKDISGMDISYLTSIAVDPKHSAQVWVQSVDYTWGEQVIDLEDPVYTGEADVEDGWPYPEFRGELWDEVRTPHGGASMVFEFESSLAGLRGVDVGQPERCQQLLIGGYEEDGLVLERCYVFCRGKFGLGPSGILNTGDAISFTGSVIPARPNCIAVCPRTYNSSADGGNSNSAHETYTTDQLGGGYSTAQELAIAVSSKKIVFNGTFDEGFRIGAKCTSTAGWSAYILGVNRTAGTLYVHKEEGALGLQATVSSTNAAGVAIDAGASGVDHVITTSDHYATIDLYVNQYDRTDTSEAPGRIILAQRNAGKAGNTSVWINTKTEAIDNVAYNFSLDESVKGSVPTSFTNGVDEAEESIFDTFDPLWDESIGTVGFWGGVKDSALLHNNTSPLRHGIWEVKSYLPAEELPGPTNEILATEELPTGSTLRPSEDLVRWKRVVVEESDLENLNVHASRFLPVEEYKYPNTLTPHLGQSVTKLSDLRFPPDASDLIAFNGVYTLDGGPWDLGIDNPLSELYPDDGDPDYPGRGKIYHLSEAYLDNTPGWYRVIAKDKPPFLKKVRTPGKRTVIDKRRMPVMIHPTATGGYTGRLVGWDERQSGDEETNRGIGLFFDPTTGDPRESKITALAFHRDRLFLANTDTIVASRAGDWDNFFISDPDIVRDSDPLDLIISSNNYTPVTHLIPYGDTLFVGTSGNRQYELIGSQNIISPLTAEFIPTANYPMLSSIDPVDLNRVLFFFSRQKLFVYFGHQKTLVEKAAEVSQHVPGYLPDNFSSITSSSYASMVMAVNEDDKESIICYRNQVAGEQVIQNAFFKFSIGQIDNVASVAGHGVLFLAGWDKYLYVINSAVDNEDTTTSKVFLSRIFLDPDEINIPRLDHWRFLSNPESDVDLSYSEVTGLTTITATGSLLGPPYFDTLVTNEGDIFALTFIGENQYTTNSNLLPIHGKLAYVGADFPSSITLSPVYLRDDANNIVPGTLNLRYGLIQTYNSKQLDVEVNVSNRSKQVYKFDHEISDDRWEDDWIGNTTVTGEISEHQVRFPILGFNQDVKIILRSDNPHPLNIASLQFNGKFKNITRFHNS